MINCLNPAVNVQTGITMKTYLQIFFNSEGSRPSDVLDILMNMGFKPMKGSHDFVYEWDMNTDIKDII